MSLFRAKSFRKTPKETNAPALRELAEGHGRDASSLDFYIIHAGGPRILDDLSKFLEVDAEKFRYSRATLMNYGNIASAVVLDALRRAFDEGTIEDGSTGMIAGFGPGITAEACVGTWIATSGSRPVQGARNGMTDIVRPHRFADLIEPVFE